MTTFKGYDKMTFSQLFPSDEKFIEDWNKTPFAKNLQNENIDIQLIYCLLYSVHANDVPASFDINRFKFSLYSCIFQYAPTWAQELRIQADIRAKAIDINNFREGASTKLNHAYNPSTEPAATADYTLPFINEQNVNLNKRSLADGYALLMSLMKTDITEKFLNKFNKLFDPLGPSEIIMYATYEEDEHV